MLKFIFFKFCGIESLANFSKTLLHLVKFTLYIFLNPNFLFF